MKILRQLHIINILLIATYNFFNIGAQLISIHFIVIEQAKYTNIKFVLASLGDGAYNLNYVYNIMLTI